MIERFTLDEMGKVWGNANTFEIMLDIETYACEAMCNLGMIPKAAYDEIKKRMGLDFRRVDEIEKNTNHDVMSLLMEVNERMGEYAKYIHLGLASADVMDTALSVQLKQAAELMLAKLYQLRDLFATLAQKFKYTLMIGRTHGVHAEPITFGLKMALWTMDVDRCIERMIRARDVVSVGMLSGTTGSFANINPKIEEHVCRRLWLKPATISTQILQRDRHAEFLSELALIGSVLEKFAVEIRNLQRTEIAEVEEVSQKAEQVSLAMPHKKNPVVSEWVSGLSRILRGNAMAAMENVAVWHERDFSHLAVEKVILPDSCILLDYMLASFMEVMNTLKVHPENMMDNLGKTLGLAFTQQVLLALMKKGVSRDQAYEWVYRDAARSWTEKMDFEYIVTEDPDITAVLSPEDIDEAFSYDYHTKRIDYIFARAGLE